MAATFGGRQVATKNEFLRLWEDEKQRHLIEVSSNRTSALVPLEALDEGLHFVRVGKTQVAQVRLMPGGRVVIS